MNEVELEKLVVRLVGDSTSFQKMLTDSVQEVQKTAQVIEQTTKKVENYGQALLGYGKKLLGFFESLGISTSLMSAFKKSEDAQQGIRRLNAAIQANGGDVAKVSGHYVEFAKNMAKITTSSKGATLGLLQEAESMGISGAAAERAAKNAIALAAAKGGDAGGYLRQTIALEQGHAEMLQRMLPQLKGVKGESEKAALAQKLLGNMFKIAEIDGSSLSAQIERIKGTFKGMSKDVGDVVAIGLKPLVNWLEKASEVIKGMPTWVTTTVVAIITLTSAAVALAHIWPIIISAIATTKASVLAFSATILANPLTWWVVGIGLAAAAVGYLAIKIRDSNEEVQRSNRLLTEQAALQAKTIVRIGSSGDQAAAKASGIADPAAKASFLAEELRKAQSQLKGITSGENANKQSISDIEKTPWIFRTGADLQGIKEAQQALENAKASGQAVEDKIRKLQSALDALKPGPGIAKLEEELKREIATFGMSHEEIKIYDLQQSKATESQLKGVRALQAKIEALKNEKEEIKKVQEAYAKQQNKHEEFVRGLEHEIATFGMTAKAAKLYEIEKEGMDEATLAYTKTLLEQKEALNAEKEMMKDVEKLMHEFETPQQKFNDRMTELNSFLEAGVISQEFYSQALKKLTDDLNKAGKAAHEMNQKFDAPRWGSAEHLRLLQDTLGNLSGSSSKANVRVPVNRDGGRPQPIPVEINRVGGNDPVRDAVVQQLMKLNETATGILNKPVGAFQPANLGNG